MRPKKTSHFSPHANVDQHITEQQQREEAQRLLVPTEAVFRSVDSVIRSDDFDLIELMIRSGDSLAGVKSSHPIGVPFQAVKVRALALSQDKKYRFTNIAEGRGLPRLRQHQGGDDDVRLRRG